MKIHRLLFAWLITLVLAAVAQDVLNNDAVVRMVKSGLGEKLIVSMVENQPGQYSVTPDEIVKLKAQGVPEGVLAAMVAKGSSHNVKASGATPGDSAAPGDPNDPMVPHDSGIWLFGKDRDGKPQMTVLERAAYQGSKTGGMLGSALTYGIKKAKTKAILPGQHASLQIQDGSPVFYFYFEDKAAGLGKTYFGVNSISNPNQFALIKLDVTKSNRETVIGQFSMLGASSGTNEKAMVAFKSERLRTGLYKVTLNAALQPGEYCFLASSGMMTTGAYGAAGGGAASAADIFDFGISLQ
ncbi:MAG: hypothetical protein ABSH50_16290 [Bryobacteraceae bacterium]|jgi:hypothetical protein